MSVQPSLSHRDALLRLLWAHPEQLLPGGLDPLANVDGIAEARKNAVLLRAASRLRQLDVSISPECLQAERLERARVAKVVELIARAADACQRTGVQFLFTKAFQHLPDMGHDVDLVLIDSSPSAVKAIVSALNAQPGPDTFTQRLARKVCFIVPGYDAPLEIHQGRLGHVGEHQMLLKRVWAGRCSSSDAGVSVPVPSREDALLIQVVQRVFGHRHLRIADLLRTANLLSDPINWTYVLDTSQHVGIRRALSDYLSAVERIHRAVTGLRLVPVALGARLLNGEDIRLSDDGWLPARVVLRAYRDKFMSDALHGDWEPVGRLCLLPMAAVAARLHLGSR